MGSLLSQAKEAPVDSVYPYPSIKGQHIAILIKLITSPEIGAEPVIILVTLPPNTALVFLKTKASHKPLVYEALSANPYLLAAKL